MSAREGKLGVAVALAMAVLSMEGLARAHAIGLSRGSYSMTGTRVRAEIVLARAEAVALIPSLDPEHRGVLSDDAVRLGRPALVAAIVEKTKVTAGSAPCPGSLQSATLTEADGITLSADFDCPSGSTSAHVELGFIDGLSPGHRHEASIVSAGRTTEMFAHTGESSFDVVGGGQPSGATPTVPRATVATSIVQMGVLHILSGYDHLMFLLGLLLLGGRTRALVAIVTAFTVGHSISLAIATLGGAAPSSRWIEPAIALSIAYVGVENILALRRPPAEIARLVDRRWLLTLPFGLVHGFGFAGALIELELPRARLPFALFSFNLGVELGQLAVIALALPLFQLARRAPWFRERGPRALSGAIAMVGFVLAVMRLRG
jgi:hypothetical protein